MNARGRRFQAGKADIKPSSPSRLPDLLPWLDVQQLQHLRPAIPQTAVINTDFLTVSSTIGGVAKEVKSVPGLQVQSAFFAMFGVPLPYGSHDWTLSNPHSRAIDTTLNANTERR